jgi:solute:Na+ symporter, SSS family
LHWVDWGIIGAYGGLLLYLGWRASRVKADTVESHLRADRSLPAWAVVFSILATEVSGATYVGGPEWGYANWNYMQFAFGALLGKWVLSVWFIRLYWRLKLDTVYGFLGRQIGPRTQRATAWAFLCGRFISTGVRVFIAAIAFSAVSGAAMEPAILIMAAVSLVFTLVGGLRAVVWTDVAQGILIMLGAGCALAVGLWKIGVPIADLLNEAMSAHKLQVISFQDDGLGWLRSTKPFPVAVLGGFLLVLATHGTDQENVQQLLGSRSEKSSARSIVLSGLFTFPIVATFLACGTMLWLYNKHIGLPQFATGSIDESRRMFPNFIMHVVPTGLRGLAFAGLFAASVAGSTLNAATSTWVSDIAPGKGGGEDLRRIRRLMLVFGAILAAVGLFFAVWARGEKKALLDIALSAMTIVYGGILGTFLTALVLRRRGSDVSAVAGLFCGVACGVIGFFQGSIARALGVAWEPIAWPWQLLFSTLVTILVASTGRRRAVFPPAAPIAL